MRAARIELIAFSALGFFLIEVARADRADTPITDADQTVSEYEQVDPGLRSLFQQAAGYAVFPSIGKGGLVLGGAYGNGILFEQGRPVGKTSMTQVTIGAQAGGQAYSEIIFFETPEALARFKADGFTFAAQVSAVALKSGVSANARYTDGVMVITATKGGLMAEASVGGQEFHFEPFTQ